MTYYGVMRGVENIFNLRLAMVELATEKGRSEAVRQYNTTRRTARKWVRRHEEQGLAGLDRNRAPKHIPHKTPKAMEDRFIELRRNHPAWRPERLKMHYELPISAKAIARIIRQAGLVRRKKRKWQKQRDLREVKKQSRPFRLITIDVKDLCDDMDKHWPPMMRLHLPRDEYSARDVRTGGGWYAYGRTKESTNAAIFASYLLSSLKHYGVDMKGLTIQTPNGSEFIGSVRKRGESAFKEVLDDFGVRHCRIY
ncbi:MAG: helix-turn-helix domain-containing protein [candidate division KSB1 bacterium]|nr:helix-turn-helix domain-containing protein [candidate division KSB1 bacterium]